MTTDKNILINSMNNLINHISMSDNNQLEIFNSLTRKDFDKIINNLEDSFPRLRYTTIFLLAQLLSNNYDLQTKFCKLFNLPEITNSKIIISNNFDRLIKRNLHKAAHIFKLLKKNEEEITKGSYIWYIFPAEPHPTIHYLDKNDLTNILNNFNPQNSSVSSTSTNAPELFDPLQCIIGLYHGSTENKKHLLSNVQAEEKRFTAISKGEKKYKPSDYSQIHKPLYLKNVNPNQPNLTLNQESSHYRHPKERYSVLQSPLTDRPMGNNHYPSEQQRHIPRFSDVSHFNGSKTSTNVENRRFTFQYQNPSLTTQMNEYEHRQLNTERSEHEEKIANGNIRQSFGIKPAVMTDRVWLSSKAGNNGGYASIAEKKKKNPNKIAETTKIKTITLGGKGSDPLKKKTKT